MSYVNRGNKLTKTTFKNIGSNAVYLDDMISGWEISDSTFTNVEGLAFELGGGRRNRVLRNTLRNISGSGFSGAGVSLDARGLGWEKANCGSLAMRVTELLYPGSPWAVRWPELRNITTDTPCAPIYCEVSGNTYDVDSCPPASCPGFLLSPAVGKEAAWHFTHSNNTRVIDHCPDALRGLCGAFKGTNQCTICAGRQQHALRQAGCTHVAIVMWCAGAPTLPAHGLLSPRPPGGPTESSVSV